MVSDGNDMRELEEYVAHYIQQLSGPAAENAWHSLIERPAALPLVVEAFDAAADPDVKHLLAEVVCEYRSADAIPFFEGLLRDDEPAMWKLALHGLVIVGGQAALDVLAAARGMADAEKRSWIDEAVEKITERKGSGVDKR